MSAIRTQIRKAQLARLWVLLNSTNGTIGNLVRAKNEGVWTPANAPQTRVTVLDNGQSRAGYKDAETEKSMALETEVIIDLPGTWRSDYDTWCDAIEAVIVDFQNRLFGVPGALRCDYVDDDPVNIELTSGQNVQVWVIHFRTTYSIGVGEIGKE